MNPTKLFEMIDQAGIETIFGALPVPLPKTIAPRKQLLDAGGLTKLMQSGALVVDANLLQRDPRLEQTRQILTAPEAVVRVDKGGLASQPAQCWAFVQGDRIVALAADNGEAAHVRLASLSSPAALVAKIEKLLPISWMPHKAYARVLVGKGDVVDIYDQIADNGANVATEMLVSDGLSDEQAQVAFDVMRTSTLRGRISFLAVGEDKVRLTAGIAVGQDGGDIWMARGGHSDELILETVLEGSFHSQLRQGWTSLGLT